MLSTEILELPMELQYPFLKMMEANRNVKNLMRQQTLSKQNQLKQKIEVQRQAKEEEVLMVKCYKCQGYGHNKFVCPTKTFITNHDIKEINEGESEQGKTNGEVLVKSFDTIFSSSRNWLDISLEVKESDDDDSHKHNQNLLKEININTVVESSMNKTLQTTGLSSCYEVLPHCLTQIRSRILLKKMRIEYNGMVYNGMLQRSHYMVYQIIFVSLLMSPFVLSKIRWIWLISWGYTFVLLLQGNMS